VRAAARNLKVLQAREWHRRRTGAGRRAGTRDAAGGAGRRADVAYYLVHSMAAGRNFGDLDLQAARHFADAAAAAGVQRIVYLGGLVPPGADSEHLVSRRRTGEVLREGPVPVTELRAGIIVGAGSAAYEVMRDLVNHVPLMVTPRWVSSRSSPLALDNLLTYLVQLPLLPEVGRGHLRRGRARVHLLPGHDAGLCACGGQDAAHHSGALAVARRFQPCGWGWSPPCRPTLRGR
jgi:uncharacterized protein YbjT (DUF2867 family)